ncbi:MrcB family domain-containing protein [Acetobacterium bakii]|uniref:MrcB family domain-containing protein n=1 Tax=Acetobacterium bakii TaxID=52689 RepID=UPI000682DED4|nr:DUF3578 domain-containing protein [Acetobacterium bakii]
MSWELLANNKAIRTTELSDFTNNKMAIPAEVSTFFKGEGERLALMYEGREYPAYIESEGGNQKLNWSKVLQRKLAETFPEYNTWFADETDPLKTPRLEFIKHDDHYDVRFILGTDDVPAVETATQAMPEETRKNPGSGLRELFAKWITGYQNYYPRDFRFSFKDIISDDIPKILEGFPNIKSGKYLVQGFAGDHQWAEIPWVAVMDRRLTDTIEKGFHLIYLLSMDSRKLYLAIVFAEPGAGAKTLSEKVDQIRRTIDTGSFETNHQKVLLANATLVAGILCYREYSEDLPGDEILAAEFQAMLRIYDQVITMSVTPEEESILEAPTAEVTKVIEMDITRRNGFFEEVSEANSSEKFLKPQIAVVGESEIVLNEELIKDIERIEKKEAFTNRDMEEKVCDIQSLDETNRPEKDAPKKVSMKTPGSLQKKYPLKNETITSELKAVLARMGNKGFYYSPELVKSYYLSLKSKPFVMIKGSVGSGKTSLPRLFAEAIGANSDNGRFQQVLVEKGWDDEEVLFGYLDNRGHFVPGPIMTLLKNSREYPEKPHFFLLDEMDQSPVEKYLRKLLEGINGNKEPLLNRDYFGSDAGSFREYGGLTFADNIYIIGTINGGEESYPVAPKFLDSGNTIEMPAVEIGVFPNYGNLNGEDDWENNQFKMQKKSQGLPGIIENLMLALRKLQEILVRFDRPMGYRCINEILAFGINSGVEGLFNEFEVIDLGIVQRILPLLDQAKHDEAELLRGLGFFCMGDNVDEKTFEETCISLKTLLMAQAMPYPRSGKQLLKRLKQ